MKKIKDEMKKAQQQQSTASKKLAAMDKEARFVFLYCFLLHLTSPSKLSYLAE